MVSSTITVSAFPTGSPYTGWMQYSLANLLSPEGELILTDGSISVFDSYGSPDIRYTTFWWVDISGVPDSYLHNDVSYSYGYGNGFALRTRTTPSSTLRIMSARVVPSTTEASPTLAMSRIPTALRTRASPSTSSTLGKSSRMVTSAPTTTTASTVPTDDLFLSGHW